MQFSSTKMHQIQKFLAHCPLSKKNPAPLLAHQASHSANQHFYCMASPMLLVFASACRNIHTLLLFCLLSELGDLWGDYRTFGCLQNVGIRFLISPSINTHINPTSPLNLLVIDSLPSYSVNWFIFKRFTFLKDLRIRDLWGEWREDRCRLLACY